MIWYASRNKSVPNPMDEIFGGRADASKCVQVIMVHTPLLDWLSITTTRCRIRESIKQHIVDNMLQILKIHHHAIIRLSWSLNNRATQGNLQPVRMSMRTLTLATVPRHMVGGFKRKLTCDDCVSCHI